MSSKMTTSFEQSPKSKKKKKRSLQEATSTDTTTATAATVVPALYQEDLGIDGVKKKRPTVSYSIQSSMKLTKEDVLKLQERKVC